MKKFLDKRETIRRLGLLWLLLLMLWLPFEDLDIRLALSLSGLLGAWGLARQTLLRSFSRGHFLLTSAFYGGLVSLFAIFLIVFKTGLHGHGFLEFSPVQLATTLDWLPLTTSLGVLMGLLLVRAQSAIRQPTRY